MASRAWRAILTSYLWVAEPRQVTFSCLSKRKSPKRKTPRSRRIPLALLARAGARQLVGRRQRGSTRTRGSLEYSRSGCDARRRLRGVKPTSALSVAVFYKPRMAHPSPARLWASARRAAGRKPAADSRDRDCRVESARDPKPRRRGSVRHPGRAFFWFLFFARAKKRNPPAVREPQLQTAAEGRSTKNISRIPLRLVCPTYLAVR